MCKNNSERSMSLNSYLFLNPLLFSCILSYYGFDLLNSLSSRLILKFNQNNTD